jgi:hypothetical protein
MHDYNNAFNMAMDMLNQSGQGDSLGIRSALKEAGSQHGIPYGPDMEAFVHWAEMKMGLDKRRRKLE